MINIFLSYARDDDELFVKRLYDDLTSAGFDAWFDRVSMPSRQLTFHQEIRDAIALRQRLLLVIGPRAVTSDYVTQEWQFAYFASNKCVNPIVRLDGVAEGGRKVDGYELIPEDLKLLHAEDFRDDGAYDVHLKNLVRQLSEELPPVGKLVAVPELPPSYRAQPERLKALRDLLLLDLKKPVVVTGAAALVGLQGMGGIGKSVMANALAHHPEVQRAFGDGIFWITLGQEPDVTTLQRWLAKELGDDGQFHDIITGKERLRDRLKERAALLILDNVWQREHAEAFNVVGSRSRILLTTRDAGLVTALAAKDNHYQVQLPTIEEAKAILASFVHQDPETLPSEAHEIIASCGRLPLALALCGGMVQGGISWLDLLDALKENDLEYLSADHPPEEQHQNVWKAMDVSLRFLPKEERARFAELAVFGKDAAVTEEAVVTLWEHTAAMPTRHGRKLLAEFVQRSLVQRLSSDTAEAGSTRVNLHDLMHSFAEGMADKRFGSLTVLHQTLLDAYRKKCSDGWATGPDDGYFFEHLAHHLAVTGNYPELRSLFADQLWMEVRVSSSGYVYFGYLSDLAIAWEMADGKVLVDERYLADCFHYGLIRTSINSLAANYDPELIVAVVKSGLWTTERAVGVAENIPSKEQASKLYTLLLETDTLTGSLRSKTINKILDATFAIGDKRARAEALTAVAALMSGVKKAEALQKALDAALAIDDENSRAYTLAVVAGQLSGAERAAALQKALDAALAISFERSRAVILAVVAGQLSGAENAADLQKVLDAALAIGEEGLRAEVLAAVAGQRSGAEKAATLQMAIDAALTISDERFRAMALAAVASQMSGAERAAVMQKALDAALAISEELFQAEALSFVAGQQSGPENSAALQKTFEAALAIGEEGLRAKVLVVVAGQLSGAENLAALQKTLEAALAIGDENSRACVLTAVAGQLSGTENSATLHNILEAAFAIGDENLRAYVLTAVAGQLSGTEKTSTLQKALDAVLAISDEKASWVNVLTVVAGQLNRAEKALTLQKAFDAALTISDKRFRAKALGALAGQLSGVAKSEALHKALDAALAISAEHWQAESLAAVAGQLSGPENSAALQKTLEAALSIGDENLRAYVLTAVAGQLSGAENSAALQKALEAALSISDKGWRAKVLAVVASQLSGTERAAVMQKALDAAHNATGPGGWRTKVLVAVAGQLSGAEKAATLQKALDEAIAINDDYWQAEAVAAVAGQLSGEVNAPALRQALNTALAISDEGWRAKILAAVASQMSGAEKAAVMQKALNAALAIGNKWHRAEVLAGLLLHMKKNSAILQMKNCLHCLENDRRSDYLTFTPYLTKISLKTETFGRIAKTIIEICSTWKWL